jgi:PIN like domain
MKKLFPGYFRPDETEIKQIWSEGLIALDANVLLNLYRYSPETREEFLKVLKLFEDKLILPNRAAREFLSNRDIISENGDRRSAVNEGEHFDSLDRQRNQCFVGLFKMPRR